MRRGKIASPNIESRGGAIPRPVPPSDDGCIRFSFKYAQLRETGKFRIEERESQYFLQLLARLQAVCSWRAQECFSPGHKSLRFHRIDFNDRGVSERGFTSLPGKLREEVEPKAFQFAVTANEHGRIHGFLIGDVFFVVWFDPEHQLYSSR